MNFFLRFLRLPFVSKGNPILNIGLWTIVTLLSYKTGNIVVSQNEPVKTFSPYGLINYLITKFIKNRNPSHGNISYWFLETGFSFVGFLIHSIGFRSTSQVQQEQMPHIVAGRINSSNIVPNMQGQTFIVGFSDEVANYIGFLFVLVRAALICVAIIFLYRLFLRRYSSSNYHEEDFMDIEARTLKKNTPEKGFLKKYWNDTYK